LRNSSQEFKDKHCINNWLKHKGGIFFALNSTLPQQAATFSKKEKKGGGREGSSSLYPILPTCPKND
jgi:hypothetical protein